MPLIDEVCVCQHPKEDHEHFGLIHPCFLCDCLEYEGQAQCMNTKRKSLRSTTGTR